MKKLFLLFPLMFIGCATMQRSQITPTDLGGVTKAIVMAKDDLKMKRYDAVEKTLDQTLKLVAEKQTEIIVKNDAVNSLTDRLNYLEPKYSEAVGKLWKARLMAIASWVILIGFFALRQMFPLLKAF